MEMMYVYSLADIGNVFYIGASKDVFKRYCMHCRGEEGLEVSHYIQHVMADGRFPDINIMYYLPKNDAYAKEGELISLFSLCGHQLVNSDFNGIANQYKVHRLPFRIKRRIPKQIKQLIEYKQQHLYYEYQHRYNSLGNTTVIGDRIGRNSTMYSQLDRPKEDRKQEDPWQSVDIGQ